MAIIKNNDIFNDNFLSYIESEDALFHYTKTNILLEKILYEKKFKLSVLSKTNDPMEYTDILFNIGWHFPDPNTDISDPNSEISKAKGEINSILRHKTKIMFLCSNIINDIKKIIKPNGWKKSRMWSQYGNNHYGICLVISKNRLETYIRKVIKDHCYFDFVKYTEQENININAITIVPSELKRLGLHKYCLDHVFNRYKDEFFFKKNIDYADESEFRVIIYDENDDWTYLSILEFIKGVIIGDRTPEVYIPIIKKMCGEIDIECRKIHYSKGKMHLLRKF